MAIIVAFQSDHVQKGAGREQPEQKKAGERIKENYSYHSSRLSPVFSHLLTPQTANHNFPGFFPKTFPYLQKKLKTFHQYCKRN